jgi:hypothetical protein
VLRLHLARIRIQRRIVAQLVEPSVSPVLYSTPAYEGSGGQKKARSPVFCDRERALNWIRRTECFLDPAEERASGVAEEGSAWCSVEGQRL